MDTWSGSLLGTLLSSSCPPAGPRQDRDTRVKGHRGLKVHVQCGREDAAGWSDQINPASLSPPSSLTPSGGRSVSSSINVPRSHRSPDEVDMDEMMAALVLSSLSCSPLLHNPAHQEASHAPTDTTAPPMDMGGEELSDSSSGYWSISRGGGSPTPSPPVAEPDGSLATPPDEGLDVDMATVLFEEPAPRRQRNSVKVSYRCLWPSCGKTLTSVVGIKRHIRTTHLSRGAEHERCSRSEEDFYYTDINQWDAPHQSPPPELCGSAHSFPFSQLSPPPPSPPSPPPLSCGLLSSSAPSSSCSFWQVQSEHSYQAPPPSHVISAAAPSSACHWMTPPTTCHGRQSVPSRVRSISVGEQWLQQHSAPCRRIRGEAKKCRKVYGIEHRDQWCTSCRWKKACQRFMD